jgi:hypothetical protein
MGEAIAMVNAVSGVVWFGFFLAILAHSLAPTDFSGTVSGLAPKESSQAQPDSKIHDDSKSIERAVADLTSSAASIVRQVADKEGRKMFDQALVYIDIEVEPENGTPRHVFIDIRVGYQRHQHRQ